MSFTLWLTGLPNSGKTRLSCSLFLELEKRLLVDLMDADIERLGIFAALSFHKSDRDSLVRALAHTSRLLNRHGIASIVAANIADADTHKHIRSFLEQYILVYCKCPVDILEQRDEKGIYNRLRLEGIDDYPGISGPYIDPVDADIVLDTAVCTIGECHTLVMDYLRTHGLIPD